MGEAVITVRLIRSFAYRNVKLMIVRNVDLNMTGAQLKQQVLERVAREPAFAPLLSVPLDTLKIHQLSAHQYKDQNLVVNLDRDDWFIGDDDRLSDKLVSHEAEISFFSREAFEQFKANPEVKW